MSWFIGFPFCGFVGATFLSRPACNHPSALRDTNVAPTKRQLRRRGRRRRLADANDHFFRAVVFAFAFADRFEFAVFLEMQVDNPALEGAERADGHLVAPAADSVGGLD